MIVNTKLRKDFTCTFPGVGKVHIDENGQFETDNLEGVRELQKDYPEFYLEGEEPVEKKVVKPKKEKAAATGEKENKEPEVQELELDEDEKEEIQQLHEEGEQALANAAKGKEGSDENVEDEEVTAYRKELEGKNNSDLITIIQDAGFPGSEWRNLKKEEKINYLIDKLKEKK